MLAKINSIKKLGLVFADFSWSPDTPAFKPVNLIYGWNGCGKTTLTRLFDEISTLSDADVQFELEDSDGGQFGRGDVFPTAVRVFNQDYIQKNVRVLESNANTISILLGEQNKELIAKIESDERELNGDPENPNKRGKIQELDAYTQKKQQHEKDNETAFSQIAGTIGGAIIGSWMQSTSSRTTSRTSPGLASIRRPFLRLKRCWKGWSR